MACFALYAAVAVLLLAVAAAPAHAAADGPWSVGRATFYDDNTKGSCHYGTDIPSMYAAWPDVQEGFGTSCGRCLEVACVNSAFNDGFGKHIDRSSVCYDEGRSVVVKIVDSCPCVHQNAYSNRRWCCGDMKHVDLGRSAFKALANEKWGVIGLRWRFVDCSRLSGSPATVAPLPKPASTPGTPALPKSAAPRTAGTPAPSAAGKAGNSRPAMPPAAAAPKAAPAAGQPSQRAATAAKPSRAQPSWVRYAQRYAGLGGGDGDDAAGYASAIQGLVDRWAGRYMQGAV